MSPLLIIIALFVGILWMVVSRRNDLKIPGPSYIWPFLGNFYEFRYNEPGTAHRNWLKKYGGPLVKYYMFGSTKVLVTDPALVKHVFLNNHLFDKNMTQYRVLGNIVGKGLLTETDEAVHKYHRSIVSPAFSHIHLKALVPIFQHKGQILVEDWQAKAAKGELISIKEDIARTTSDVIGEAAFGYQLHSQRNNSPTSIYNIFSTIFGTGFSIWDVLPGIRYFVPAYHERNRFKRILDSAIGDILDKKVADRGNRRTVELSHSEEIEAKRNRDLLDVLMDCENDEGQKLTREELVGQVKIFMLAGYETSSVCILWTMHLLSKHLDIQQRVADEVLSVIGKHRPPTAEDIDKMPYLLKVVKESLRIYPPIHLVLRQACEDTELGGYHIPKGTHIVISTYIQHHFSPVWKNPETFDPERWSNEESESSLMGSYIPFILGARNCIGSKFALLEVRVILALVLQKLSWTKEPGSAEPKRSGRLSIVPKTPIKLVMEERK